VDRDHGRIASDPTSERLTGALLDRLTHRVHILEANGPSYRLGEAKRRLKKTAAEARRSATPPRQADGADGTDGQG
jgi:hypothetical protein